LAKRLKRPFADLDQRIAREARQTIPQIFASEGEDGFRKRESEAVAWAASLKEHVIAAGGGALLAEENTKLLKGSGLLVCLTARPDVIFQRTTATLPSRPLLNAGSPRERIAEMMQLRAASYAQADVTVDTSDKSIEEVAEEIMKKVEGQR
jgi:shikimate kinase